MNQESSFSNSLGEFLTFLKEIHPNCLVEYQSETVFGYSILIQFRNKRLFLFFHKFLPNQSVDLKRTLPTNHILIWEHHWIHLPEIVKSRIKYSLGILPRVFARKTKIIKLTKSEALNFQEKNHLMIPLKGKVSYGLTYKNELLCCMVFSQPRNWNKPLGKSYEILRFCNSLNQVVYAGFSKLLNHFIDNHKPVQLMTYADNSFYQHNLYEKIGFIKNDDQQDSNNYSITKDSPYAVKGTLNGSMQVKDLGNSKYIWIDGRD